MWNRFGPGPVFAYESLLNARRWQVYAGRSVFVLVILSGMTIVWMTRDHLGPGPCGDLPQDAIPACPVIGDLLGGSHLAEVRLLALRREE